MMPPSPAVMITYFPWPTAQRVRSRGVSLFTNANGSRPVISTCRSTATSHTVTCLTRCPYSASRSPKQMGKSMWL